MKTLLMTLCLSLPFCLTFPINAGEKKQAWLPLWSEGAPGAKGKTDKDIPAVQVFLPVSKKPTPAIVICPGGGYGHLAMDHEGLQVARWLNKIGVAGIVLRYRISPDYRHPSPMHDVQRALRFTRYHAKEWNIDVKKVGVLGVSAGGHLASTAATHFDSGSKSEGKLTISKKIDSESCRPDFAVLCYPVITFTKSSMHKGSRRNLLGNDPDPKLIQLLSNELQVTKLTPPTFLVHTNEDTGVPPENSILFYLALRKAKIPAEMHIFEKGRHGLGLGSKDQAFSAWPNLCERWLKARGILEK